MKIKELFSDKSKWIKGSFAKDRKGNRCLGNDPEATCWCLLGAIQKCYPLNKQDKIKELFRNKVGNIVFYNDSVTFEDIKKLVEELDI